MAIVQISRITQRKGLFDNLPQLAGAEFGWAVDQRRLFIGNGTLEEGAPVIGNTEILTEFSDILAFQTTYTYKGAAAGYTVQTGPTSNDPITQSLQSWLDQWASVKDFGATGDGVTDDTAAINRALNQLYCVQSNPQIRRGLFFPAGVYLVNQTVIIPPYAYLYGEGADSSKIVMAAGDDSASRAYVARTGDNYQDVGPAIGSLPNAIKPQFVTVENMAFASQDQEVDIMLIEDAINCTFRNVGFFGPFDGVTAAVPTSDTANIACVRFSSLSEVCTNIVFDSCLFESMTYGINTDDEVRSVHVTASKFNDLYQGVMLGTGTPINGGPTGTAIAESHFDNVYAEGIKYGDIRLNGSAHNIFYNVGNHLTALPETVIIDIGGPDNISVGDMFERSNTDAATEPRIRLNNKASIAFTNGAQLQMGTYTRETGQRGLLVNNETTPTTITNLDGDPVEIDTAETKAFAMEYTITRNTYYRTGKITVVAAGGAGLSYSDDYVENDATIGVTLTATESAGIMSVQYETTNIGPNADINYSITRF